MSQLFYSAFPGGKHTIHEIFEVDDRVFHRGRHPHREFMGMPPTGKEIVITEMTLDRFAHGKLVEHRAEADVAGLMQQLAANPYAAAQAT